MRKVILTVLGILIIAGAFLGARYLIASKEKPKKETKKKITAVRVDTVANRTVEIVVPANGKLTAKKRIELYAEVAGVFERSAHLYREGQKYDKGELLLFINNDEFFAQVQSARSNLNQSITSIMADLKLDYPASFQNWQAYLADLSVDKAIPELPEPVSEQERYFLTGRGIYSQYHNVKNLEQRLSKFRLYAPFDGVLTEANVTEGTLVRVGQKLGEFIQDGTFELKVSISADFADLIKVGKIVQLQNVTKSKTYQGEVTRINANVEEGTQTITVIIEVSDKMLKSGQYLTAQIKAKEVKNAIRIDRNLLQNQNEVFTVQDSLLELSKVEPVYYGDDKVVLKGLEDGQLLVSRNVPAAYEGMRVEIQKSRKTTTDTTSTEKPQQKTERP